LLAVVVCIKLAVLLKKFVEFCSLFNRST